jgi:hypothetical protein
MLLRLSLPGKRLLMVLVTCFVANMTVLSQTGSKFFSVSGSIGVYADWYSFSTNDPLLQPRRPAQLIRIVGTPTLHFGKYFSLPLNLMTSFQQTNVITPYIPNQNFGQFVQNPLQNLGIAPKYKWAQLFLGSHLPEYSDLTVGVVQLFGGGLELKPGKWLLGVNFGTSQRAVDPDIANGITGAYKRKIWAARVGYGSDTATFMTINVAHFKDDPNSIAAPPPGLVPQEGLVIGPKMQVRIKKKLFWKGEAAFSQYVPNQFIYNTKFLSDTAKVKDYAVMSSINFNEKDYGVSLGIKYFGGGFVPAGYPFFQNDRLEYSIAPRFSLFKRKLMVNGSIGQRINNVSNTLLQKTKQLTGSANIFWQPNERFSLNAGYSNFGFRSNLTGGGLTYQLIGNTVNISPAYTLVKPKAMHTITANAGYDITDDYNVIAATRFKNKTTNAMLMHIYSSLLNPLHITTAFNYFKTEFAPNTVEVKSVEITAGYRFLQQRLRSSFTAGMAQTKFNSFSSDKNPTARLKLDYRTKNDYSFSLSAGNNYYKYGSFKPGKYFNEVLVQTAIIKTFK